MSDLRIETFGVGDAAQIALALVVRFEVFVREQGVAPEIEIDEHDRNDARAVHVLALEGERPVGAGRYYAHEDGCAQIGRMAVVASYRHRGVGRRLLDALVEKAQEQGYARIVLHAQTQALGFYEHAGFTAHGVEFLDAGIPHIEMVLTRPSPRRQRPPGSNVLGA